MASDLLRTSAVGKKVSLVSHYLRRIEVNSMSRPHVKP